MGAVERRVMEGLDSWVTSKRARVAESVHVERTLCGRIAVKAAACLRSHSSRSAAWRRPTSKQPARDVEPPRSPTM